MKASKRAGGRLVLGTLVSALLASACVGPPQDETSGATGDTESEATGSEAAADGDEIIRVSMDSEPDILEPHFFRTDAAYTLTANFYEPLIQQTYAEDGAVLEGTDEYEGALAEDWEISEDGLEATFHLREDAQFANGDPITAEDIKYVFQRSIEGPGYITALLPFIGIETADQIEVVDEHTLVIRPSFESPLFERFMTFQVFGAMNQEVAEQHATDENPWATDWFTTNVTASGPYDLASWDEGREAVLEPNPNYWGRDQLQNDGVILRTIPNAEERALLLRSGELDVADGLPPRMVKDLEESGELAVHRIPSSRITYLGMNNDIAPFDDAAVRQAISYALPYEAIRDQVLEGYASIAKSPVPPAMESYAGDDFWNYDTDIEKAKQLLEEAGVEPFSTELGVRQSVPEDVEAAVFIQDALRQLEIDVEIVQLPDAEFNERLNERSLPMFFHDWYSWGEDPFFQLTFLLQSEAFTNYASYANDEVDRLIEEGTLELDPERRAELSRQAQELIIEDAPWGFLYSADYLVVSQPEVTGITRPYDQHLRFQYLSKD